LNAIEQLKPQQKTKKSVIMN